MASMDIQKIETKGPEFFLGKVGGCNARGDRRDGPRLPEHLDPTIHPYLFFFLDGSRLMGVEKWYGWMDGPR